jgi:hypothetical protein
MSNSGKEERAVKMPFAQHSSGSSLFPLTTEQVPCQCLRQFLLDNDNDSNRFMTECL